jgi:hypothetical protein
LRLPLVHLGRSLPDQAALCDVNRSADDMADHVRDGPVRTPAGSLEVILAERSDELPEEAKLIGDAG